MISSEEYATAQLRRRQAIEAFQSQARAMALVRNAPLENSRGSKSSGSPAAISRGDDVNYLARKHSIPRVVARNLIAQNGNDRAKLNAAARKLKK